MKEEIVHNKEKMRFETMIDGLLSEVNYRINDENNLIIVHTGVPNELRGKGIAADLTKAMLEYAKENSLKIIPLCPYTQTYLERNPQYSNLIAKGY